MKINNDILKELVKDITFTVEKYIEDDNSVTLSLLGFDLVVNGRDADGAISLLIKDLREYAIEYNNDVKNWESDINRKKQIKEIIKVIITEDDEELKESFRWKKGRN